MNIRSWDNNTMAAAWSSGCSRIWGEKPSIDPAHYAVSCADQHLS